MNKVLTLQYFSKISFSTTLLQKAEIAKLSVNYFQCPILSALKKKVKNKTSQQLMPWVSKFFKLLKNKNTNVLMKNICVSAIYPTCTLILVPPNP